MKRAWIACAGTRTRSRLQRTDGGLPAFVDGEGARHQG